MLLGDIQLCMSNSIVIMANAFHSFHISVVQNSANYIVGQVLSATYRLIHILQAQ